MIVAKQRVKRNKGACWDALEGTVRERKRDIRQRTPLGRKMREVRKSDKNRKTEKHRSKQLIREGKHTTHTSLSIEVVIRSILDKIGLH